MADAESTMIANFKEKTGKTLDDWLKVASKMGAKKHGEIVATLKKDHGMTHGFANVVAMKHLKSDAGSLADGGADLVAEQYAGEKAALKPIYDALIAAVQKFGTDVEVAPKKAYVSLRRKKQFAILQPSAKSRLDVGINLKDAPAKGRLEASGSFNAMVSHRVRVEKKADADKELIGWLKAAYDAA
ncbi:MAG TPA: DUF4287 domain-containing protein [Parvularcula sp.]|nr:DUF4287 domain-containing protein [Parvularcula sp.]HBS34145.1 DUF4287 domain-containing protein [Parvularcula sp.]